MRVRDVADSLHVAPTTLRSWSNAFRQFISPRATPAKGQVRGYSTHDLPMLAAVAHYKAVHRLTYAQIRERLQAGDHKALDIAVPEPPPGETSDVALVSMSLVQGLYAEIARLEDRLAEGAREGPLGAAIAGVRSSASAPVGARAWPVIRSGRERFVD